MLEEPATVLMPNISDTYRDVILVTGGLDGECENGAIVNKVWALDAKTTPVQWDGNRCPPMLYARKFHKPVLLPDCSILIVGGSQDPNHNGATRAVFWPEVLLNGEWQYCNPEESPRAYHSIALLTKKGEVLSAGGNTRMTDYQVFKPHYLTGNPTRPAWSAALLPPNQVGYASSFQFKPQLPFGQSVARVVLTTPASITHGQDPNQRCVVLDFDVGGGSVTAYTPLLPSMAPKGIYLLWMVSSAGIPSEGRWIKVQ
jgi:hypothetical protein